MMRLAVAALLAAALALCCTGCSGLSLRAEDLMRPPKLTEEQTAIENALKASAISSDITYKYPQSGDYRSAFVFHDLDGDGLEEALVFYAAPSLTSYARVALLDQLEGGWTAVEEMPGPGQDVAFICFGSLTRPGQQDIVIGWSSPEQEGRQLGVYAYQDGGLEELYSSSYDSYLLEDLSEDGLDDLFLLEREGEASSLNLVRWDGYQLARTSRMALAQRISQVPRMTAGMLSSADTQKGLFLDELLSDGSLATEVFTVEDGELYGVIAYDMPSDQALLDAALAQAEGVAPAAGTDLQTPTLYDLTLRINTADRDEEPFPLCGDVNGDGIVEIPTSRRLPGYTDAEEGTWLYLTEYNQLKGRSLERIYAAAVNRQAGYQVVFPEAWIGQVSIASRQEDNEWRFVAFSGTLAQSRELARIRVVSQKDYQDKFLGDYQVFAERGMFTFYGYVPPQEGQAPQGEAGLQVSLEELRGLFSLV